MFRVVFILLSKAAWARDLILRYPPARKMALRFVAGEQLNEAVKVVQSLNAEGLIATLDHLGEDVTTEKDARRATTQLLECLETIETQGLKANLSIKLTQIGLKIDEELCLRNLRGILRYAKSHSNFIRIDIEDVATHAAARKIYLQMREEGFDNLGLAVQSYLRDALATTSSLLVSQTTFRLVKGAYREPRQAVYTRKRQTDENFDRLTRLLMDASLLEESPAISADGRQPAIPAIATHDEKRIAYARAYAQEIGLPENKFEFQMLYGIRRELQKELADEGYNVRVYVPYGEDWYPYFMRRLAERPANLWFMLRNYLKD